MTQGVPRYQMLYFPILGNSRDPGTLHGLFLRIRGECEILVYDLLPVVLRPLEHDLWSRFVCSPWNLLGCFAGIIVSKSEIFLIIRFG